MISLTLDGSDRSLELPPDCLSVAAAASFAKRELGAAWADSYSPPPSHATASTVTACAFTGGTLADLTNIDQSGNRPSRKRLFLSARGWQLGGTVGDNASLLAFRASSAAEALTAEELPASLLRGGLLKLRAFSSERSQVTISLPDGRSVALPVSEATRGAGVLAYTAALLGCAPDGLRLWPSGAGGMLKEADRIIPGTHFRAKLLTDSSGVQIFVKTLTGKTLTVCLTLDSTTDELKQAIMDQQAIPVDQQRIIFAGRQLEDGKTLASQGISREATAHLVLRLRGGMLAASSGRAGNFEELGLAADERQVAVIAAADRTPLEVVLPDGSIVLLDCEDGDIPQQVLAALRKRLAATDAAEAAVLAADVDGLEDVASMRDLLRQAQAVLRQRRRLA